MTRIQSICRALCNSRSGVLKSLFTKLSNPNFNLALAEIMFNLSRYVTMSSVVRNFGVTKKLFASTTVLAEKQDPADPQKPLDSTKKIKSE